MCQRNGVGIITWAPMAMGVLAGRYKKAGEFPENSRAKLRGGFYADRVSDRGIEVGIQFTQIAKEGWGDAASARGVMVQRPAGDHRTPHRAPGPKSIWTISCR